VFARFVLLSIFAHIILLWALSHFRPTVLPVKATPALKTYLVIEPKVVKKEQPAALEQSQPTAPVEEPSPELSTKPSTTNTKEEIVVTAAQHDVQTHTAEKPLTTPSPTESTAQPSSQPSESKVLNFTPASLLESINAKAYSTYSQTRQAPTGRPNPTRLGVPEAHQNLDSKDTRTVISQNNLWTEYKDGDSCYKEMNHDPNNPPPDGFPKTWTAPVECKQSAIKDAYKDAMNKWLPKKH
jgi:hypothetical protein